MHDKHTSGIYKLDNQRHTSIDITAQLPETAEACLSVASLLVMRDVQVFLGPDDPLNQ